ncbi:MAG TPA: FHA domain-containing protein [Pyrinomonadaceae bacterium]|jgi:predicted component of type VI protein secretion system
MPNAKLKFDGREIEIDETVTTIGRASDNTISFSHDSNVSRFHVEIERRGEDFYLVELGSRNGTTVNDEPIETEKLLGDGDLITLGNSSVVEFYFETGAPEENAENSPHEIDSSNAFAAKEEAEIAKDAQTASKFPLMLAVAGAACGLAVVFVVAAILFSSSGAKPCEAKASITNPPDNELLRDATEITVQTEDRAECARRAIFLLDGVEFASAAEQPFAASLDPNNYPELADGMNHSLKIVLEDADGNKWPQATEVALVFETKTIETPTPTPGNVEESPTPTPKTAKGKVTLTEIQMMSDKLVKSLGSSANYRLNKEFLEEVQKKTGEYAAAEGFFARAQKYQDVIKNAYLVETDVGAPLGFLTAMSRSKFDVQKQGANEGLWQMSNDFAAANALNVGCAESLSDAAQICAAKASSLYLKSLLRTVFEGDVVYTVAAFGMSPDEAFTWKQTLPQERADFWKEIKSPNQREELIRFFAAGVVAENPQKFGIKKDNPVSQLY